MNMNLKELYYILDNRRVVIYGAGIVASRFYEGIVNTGHSNNVEAFVTTKAEGKTFYGMPWLSIDDLKCKDIFVCIAVHESIKEEIEGLLEVKGYKDRVNIYSYLLEIQLGVPILENKRVYLKDIWKANECRYLIQSRYLAIEEYYGKNNIGYECYIKCLSLFSREHTAKKRLDKFIELIKNWEKSGYDCKQLPVLLETNDIIDGTHRISLAMFYNYEYINCKIYSKKNSYEEIVGINTILEKNIVNNSLISRGVIAELDRVGSLLREKYNG